MLLGKLLRTMGLGLLGGLGVGVLVGAAAVEVGTAMVDGTAVNVEVGTAMVDGSAFNVEVGTAMVDGSALNMEVGVAMVDGPAVGAADDGSILGAGVGLDGGPAESTELWSLLGSEVKGASLAVLSRIDVPATDGGTTVLGAGEELNG